MGYYLITWVLLDHKDKVSLLNFFLSDLRLFHFFLFLKVGLNTINKSINIFFYSNGYCDGSRVQSTDISCAYQIADGVQPKENVGGGEVI